MKAWPGQLAGAAEVLAALAAAGALPQTAGMSPDRPPETEGEFRLVHGPWPRWAMHLSLVKVALFAAAMVGLCLLGSLLALWVVQALG